jgi:hypothetical protein
VTNKGRLLGMLVMTLGVGLFGVLTGFLANAFLGNKDPETSLAELEALLAQRD